MRELRAPLLSNKGSSQLHALSCGDAETARHAIHWETLAHFFSLFHANASGQCPAAERLPCRGHASPQARLTYVAVQFLQSSFYRNRGQQFTLLSIIKMKYPFFYKKWNNYFLFYAKSILSFSRFFQLSEQQEIERFVRTAEEFEDSLPTG